MQLYKKYKKIINLNHIKKTLLLTIYEFLFLICKLDLCIIIQKVIVDINIKTLILFEKYGIIIYYFHNFLNIV
jgi:hypothetical protein